MSSPLIPKNINRLITFSALTIFICAIGIIVYVIAYHSALKQDHVSGKVRLSEAITRLNGQLYVYKALINILAEDSNVIAHLNDKKNLIESATENTIHDRLEYLRLTYGALHIDVLDRKNHLTISSSLEVNRTYDKDLIQAALNSRLGYKIIPYENQRLLYLSRAVKNKDKTIIGTVIIAINLAELELEWPIIPEPILFLLPTGEIISSNRPELITYYNTQLLSDHEILKPNDSLLAETFNEVTWNFTLVDKKQNVQLIQSSYPLLNLSVEILVPTKSAQLEAQLQSGLAIAICLVLLLITTIIMQQRKKLSIELEHSATLEQRVEERTKALKAAQKELVETSNLAALGRMSAGISHEVNQPLGAILNFARNGKRFIEKARFTEAGDNLTQIAEQVNRINRIISNLRAFAKQEHTPVERIDFVKITQNALQLKQNDLYGYGIELQLNLPSGKIHVMAGKVRLEQVILNLVSNAIDAMQKSDTRILTVTLKQSGNVAILQIQDTGSGIEEKGRVFEPFYTTKELGTSKGLGMGLALSFGLITSFNGKLWCENLDLGASFTIELPIVKPINKVL